MDDHSRQGFLNPQLDRAANACTIGVIGLSGGGSHIVTQLAHYGFNNFVLCDSKVTEAKHLHRMIGATIEDAEAKRPKTVVMERAIRGLRRRPSIRTFATDWTGCLPALKTCDLIFAAVDTVSARRDIELFTRRYSIALIDVGMDVSRANDGSYRVAGRMFASLPGETCMRCAGFINDSMLAKEAAAYGMAGIRPQVVSVNGVVASVAVLYAIDLLTAKTGPVPPPCFITFDAGSLTMGPHPYLSAVSNPCACFRPGEIGDARPVPIR